ncbi:MAG: tetrahydromethanopterin S-methyltransferase subunit D [Methanimicrococcus sp.]|nr:tetrahydromethanopterin S-methyltransferase subunit D [Methanimicrococcus sp.]
MIESTIETILFSIFGASDPAFVFFLLLLVTLGGILITLSVHLIPVGGAPAAMAQATGVGTGTTQLAAGSGLSGLLVAVAVSVETQNMFLGIILGGIGAAVMISLVMLMSNIGYIYGIGVPPASGKAVRDPITNDRQDIYVSKGTEGHGVPTASFISGIFGGFLGGAGGSLIYEALIRTTQVSSALFIVLAVILSIALFFINAVIASYNIGGTIEGFYDEKFKKLARSVVVSAAVTFICGALCLLTFINFGGFI